MSSPTPTPASTTSSGKRRAAGPLLRIGDATEAIIDAIEEDNPDVEVSIIDHAGYIRVEAEGGLILRRETVEEILGRNFKMQEIELLLAGYSGLIDMTQDHVRWYFKSAGPTTSVTTGAI
ncbi:MmoB/DmpM family protein [Mycobacterium kansasii]